MLTATPLAELVTHDAPNTKTTCSWPECERTAIARGLCQLHYFRLRAGRDPDCATQREEALVAWLRLVGTDAEDDAAFDAAWDRVDAAMDAWLARRAQLAEAGRCGIEARQRRAAGGGR